MPEVWCSDIDDAETKARCWAAYRASLDYYKIGLEQRSRVFQWQHFSTRVIFVVVLFLVVIGVFFAWLQFRREELTEAHQLEIGVKGIKMTSTALGLMILALSLAFFYLYLRYVYPIEELF